MIGEDYKDQRLSRMSNFFDAQYPYTCAACGDRHPAGTPSLYVDGEVVSSECNVNEMKDVLGEDPRAACPHCFTIHAGECL